MYYNTTLELHNSFFFKMNGYFGITITFKSNVHLFIDIYILTFERL